jgi:hypothetical protein
MKSESGTIFCPFCGGQDIEITEDKKEQYKLVPEQTQMHAMDNIGLISAIMAITGPVHAERSRGNSYQ